MPNLRFVRPNFVLLSLLAAQTWVVGESPKLLSVEKAAISDAKESLGSFFFDAEILKSQSVFYSGSYLQVVGDDRHDGEGAFCALWARNRLSCERFWNIKDTPLGKRYYDELRVKGKSWYSVNEIVNEQGEDGPPSVASRHARIDPSVAVLCLAGGLVVGRSAAGRSGFAYITDSNIISAERKGSLLAVVFDIPKRNSWAHIVFSEKQGMKPILFAVTHKGIELNEDASNARFVNRQRWKLSGASWVPEAGENVDYLGATSESFRSLIVVKYKCVWLDASVISDDLFRKDDLKSGLGNRLEWASDSFKRIESIPDVDRADFATR